MSERPESPYKGLNAFEDTKLDALLFFGRERETEIVVANLIASRLTVLYGPSGVGKSSLLHAAVARSLRALPEEPLVVVFSSWSDDPNAALAEAVAEVSGLEPNRVRRRRARGGAVRARRLPRPRPGRGVLPLPRRRQRAWVLRRGAPRRACHLATRERPRLLAGGLTREARPLRRSRPQLVREHTAPRSPGPQRGEGSSAAAGRTLRGADRRDGDRRARPRGAGSRRGRRRPDRAGARWTRGGRGCGKRSTDRGAVSPARDAAPVGRGARSGVNAPCGRRPSTGSVVPSTSSRSTSRVQWPSSRPSRRTSRRGSSTIS